MPNPDFIEYAKKAAKDYGLDPALVCAVVEQESNWNSWAIRFEPAFEAKYLEHLNVGATEKTARSISWGLMQLMGENARELGFTGEFLSLLCDPETGLEWGCRHLSVQMTKTSNDVHEALLRWNGGGNLDYPTQVMARMPTYTEAA
jgi:soluble lytic murein transglycosylase-like protein